jgi:hypothetical protein
MPSLSLSIAHRPVRVGFVVRARSASDFLDAVEALTGDREIALDATQEAFARGFARW